MTDRKSNSDEEYDLEWIQMRQKMYESYADDNTSSGKFIDKMKENPFVPIGAAATTLCLVLGLVNLVKRESKKQQFYMRARVAAQGFTVVALVVGMGASVFRKAP